MVFLGYGIITKGQVEGPFLMMKNKKELVKKLLDETPNDPKSVLQSLFDKTGQLISRQTLNRLAKKYRFSFQRLKKSLK